MLVVLTGSSMRFFGDVPVTAYREYVHGILTFNAHIPEALIGTTAKLSLFTHVILVNALAIYFPFSKLMHLVGSIVTNQMRYEGRV